MGPAAVQEVGPSEALLAAVLGVGQLEAPMALAKHRMLQERCTRSRRKGEAHEEAPGTGPAVVFLGAAAAAAAAEPQHRSTRPTPPFKRSR